MNAYIVFCLLIGVALVLGRKKIEWGQWSIGLLCAFLLLGTPVGPPIGEAVQSIAHAITDAGESIVTSITGRR